jgi:hypothetical protein
VSCWLTCTDAATWAPATGIDRQAGRGYVADL